MIAITTNNSIKVNPVLSRSWESGAIMVSTSFFLKRVEQAPRSKTQT
jgi:hypothetical protein